MAKYEFDDKHTFINPYNFVPNAAKKTTASEPSKNDQLHTGVLHCRLITRTPIIIPDTARRKEDENVQKHYEYPFMKINGKYAIPGSSIRGPVRSVYETMTNSCYATVREDQIVSNRAVKPFKPGLLRKEKGTWKLYEADRYKLPKDKFNWFLDESKSDYGQKVWFTASGGYVTNIYDGKKAGTEEGYLFKGEPFPGKRGKKNESVFVYKNLKKPLSIDDKTLEKAVNHLKNLLIDYHDQKDREQEDSDQEDSDQKDRREPKESHTGYKHIKQKMFDGDACIPVWYEYEGQNLHLSFAQIGRYTYEKSLNEILGPYDACKKKEDCCAACRLFGMAAKEDAAAGKVRFTDAFLTEGGNKKVIDLRELGAPHITYLPFYMENTMDYDDDGARIRGRKYYWHHKPDMALAGAEKINKMNDTMEYLDDQSVFSFNVYYERVTGRQLKELMWVLCMGENMEKGSMCHKVGHAKPLGFGSVKIVIDGGMERTYSAEKGYLVEKLTVDEDKFRNVFEGRTDPDTMRAMLAMADLNTIPEKMQVRYPYVGAYKETERALKGNVLASHKWYSQNYKLGAKKAKYELAPADAGAKTLLMPYLEAYEFTDRDYANKDEKRDEKNKEAKKKPGAGQRQNKDDNSRDRNRNAHTEGKNVKGSGAVYSGSIIFMNTEKGYGFIKPDKGDEDMYFRVSGAPDFDHMKKGDRVSYQIGKDREGKTRAVHVRRCGSDHS